MCLQLPKSYKQEAVMNAVEGGGGITEGRKEKSGHKQDHMQCHNIFRAFRDPFRNSLTLQ